ncbi:hypothetical protein ACE1TI_11750 [Alteribacillus sp. JSM 102045]|uniref:hypothetical protein n=1 Tax=Alteribacillus sp. JSM 102045 TaxID=1562101 RepID=UPI0035C038F2
MNKTKNQNDSIEKELHNLLESVEAIEKAAGEVAASASQLDAATDERQVMKRKKLLPFETASFCILEF